MALSENRIPKMLIVYHHSLSQTKLLIWVYPILDNTNEKTDFHDPAMSWALEDCCPLEIGDVQGLC